MDTAQENTENVWRKKSSSRRSSILKLDRPTLADLDVNKKTETKLSKRSSKRVSFAETYQVKEFPKDSPQRWLRDLQNDINSGNECTAEDKSSGNGQTPTGHEILGLEQLLNGQIQTQGQEEDVQGLNKTVIDGADMEETMCTNTTIAQNTTLTHPRYDEHSDDSDIEDKKVDTLSFISTLMKAPKRCDDQPLIKSMDDSDEEEYKTSSFFRGGGRGGFWGKGGLFSNNVDSDDEEEPVGKIDSKAFLSKLKSINTMSKQFAQEEEKRKEKENHTVIFDGLEGEMEVTGNFTDVLQSMKKRQSVGNVLESTRIFAENDDGMEMTANLTCNLEVVKSNLPISELNASKGQVSQIVHSKLGTSTLMGRSNNPGLEQTRVFTDYEDPTTHMDFTVAGGVILSSAHSVAAGTEGDRLPEGADRSASCPLGTATPKHATALVGKTASPSEVTIRFGQQEIDADMEMTEALDPTLIISSSGGATTMVKRAPDQSARSHNRALTDVTADFGADGLKTRRDEGRRRIPSISPVDMDKENITVHFKTADTQGEMDFTSCLPTQMEGQNKGVVFQDCTTTGVALEKTKIFGASDDVGDMELTACLVTRNTIQNVTTHIDDTVSFKQKVPQSDKTEKAVPSSSSQDVTRVFGKDDMTAAMELTGCQGMLTVKQTQPNSTCSDEKTRVFDSGDVTAAMEFTECVSAKVKRESSEGKTDDKTIHFEQQGGAMELTSCQPSMALAAQGEGQSEATRVFGATDVTAAMEFTECVPANLKRSLSEGNTDDKTILFEKRGGSMELTSCQPGIVSDAQCEGQSDRTRVFGATDVTAAMDMTECQPNRVSPAAAEKGDLQQSKEAEVTEDGTAGRRGKSGRSLPGVCMDSVPADKSVQQRRSLYSGSINTAPPQVDGFSTQSLKRKLYSFDMMMAGAKAKTVKVAKLTKSESCDDKNTEVCSDSNTKVDQSPQKESQISPAESEQASTKPGDTSGKDVPKLSPDHADLMHTATDILKLGVPEGELSALEMLKMAVLEEDTDMLDDTKLLELHMMAKDTKHKANNSSLSQKDQADDGHGLAEKTISEEEDTKSQTIDSEEQPTLVLDEDMNVTQQNAVTGLALMLDKMNKSRGSAGKTPGKETLAGGALAIGKHGSPEPVSSADMKKPKLVDPPLETLADSQPKDKVPDGDNDTVTSLDSANSESSEEHTRGHHSQSAISLSQSLLSFSLLDKKYDENDGPWDFGTFCERTGISQFKPKCSRRSSINILPALKADSLQEVLRLQTLTATETQVKDDMYERLQQQIERDEEEVEGQQRIVSEKEPVLFSQLRNSQITKEEVHSCYKACQRSAKAKMKRERIAISKQCLHNLKGEKERMCAGVNEVVTRAERVISDLSSIDNLLADIDSQLEDLGEEPAVTEAEAEEVARLKEHLLIKTQELRKSEEEKAQALRQRSELMQRQSDLEAESQRQELQMLEWPHTGDGLGEVEALQNRLGALHRVLEWRVKELSPARDVFLFLYGGVEMSVTYDLVQHKTVDSVVLKTHLADASSPWSHLASRLVVGGVDCVRLRDRYSSRDTLPQMLNEISRLTAEARNLASQISYADLKHKVAVHDYCVSVSLLNTRRVRKVVITFVLEPSTCKAVDTSVNVVIGAITKETVADVIKETISGPEFLTKSISRVQTLLNS